MSEPRRPRRVARRTGAAFLLSFTAVSTLAACGGGGGGGPSDLHPPSLSFASFQADQTAVQAGAIEVAWVAADEDDEASVSIFADADGDLDTTADRFTLVDEVTERDGVRQQARAELGDVPGGRYAVVGRIRDGKGGEQRVTAPGRLIVEDRALVAPLGGIGIEIVAHLPRDDGSFDVFGRYRGVVDFDPRHRQTSTSRTWDLFVAQYSPRGVIRWLRVFESTGDMTASAMRRDRDGSLLITGSFGGTLTLPDQSTVRGDGVDSFVARVSPLGEPVWVRTASSLNGDEARDLAILADGSIVVAGTFCIGNTTYPISFGEDRNGQPVTLPSAGIGDAFVVRYESDGTPVWASSAGGAGNDRGTAIAVLDGDRIVVGGAFEGRASFGDGSVQHTAAGVTDAFLAEWTAAGALVGVQVLTGPGIEEIADLARCAGGDLAVLANSDSAQLDVAGRATVQLATGLDAVLARFAADDTLRWAIAAVVGPGPCSGEHVEALADDALLLTGTYADGARFGPGGPTLPANGATDGFASKLGPDGSLHWLRRFGSAGPLHGLAVSARPDGTVMVSGDRGASELTVFTQRGDATLPAAPTSSLFIARFNPDGELGRAPLASRVAGSATIARGRVNIVVDGLIATWTGFDDVETSPAVQQLLDEHPMVALLVVQRADGPIRGSAHLPGARAIARAGLETHIPSNGSAYGGGIDLFLGGRRRTAAEGANVTVRSWVDANRQSGHSIRGDRQHPAHGPWLEFYDALGVPRDYYWFYLEVPRDDPRRLTRAEIEALSIVTE